MSTRTEQYIERVEAFKKAFGPKFNLTQVTMGETNCEACGRKSIHVLFIVKSKGSGSLYTVGSECQALVLTDAVDLAKLPARHLRKRDIEDIVKAGRQFGLQIGVLNTPEFAAEKVLEARRKDATKRSWVSRRALKVAVPKP